MDSLWSYTHLMSLHLWKAYATRDVSALTPEESQIVSQAAPSFQSSPQSRTPTTNTQSQYLSLAPNRVGTDSLFLESLEVALSNKRSQSTLKNMGQPSPPEEDNSHSTGEDSQSRHFDTEPLSEEVIVSERENFEFYASKSRRIEHQSDDLLFDSSLKENFPSTSSTYVAHAYKVIDPERSHESPHDYVRQQWIAAHDSVHEHSAPAFRVPAPPRSIGVICPQCQQIICLCVHLQRTQMQKCCWTVVTDVNPSGWGKQRFKKVLPCHP